MDAAIEFKLWGQQTKAKAERRPEAADEEAVRQDRAGGRRGRQADGSTSSSPTSTPSCREPRPDQRSTSSAPMINSTDRPVHAKKSDISDDVIALLDAKYKGKGSTGGTAARVPHRGRPASHRAARRRRCRPAPHRRRPQPLRRLTKDERATAEPAVPHSASTFSPLSFTLAPHAHPRRHRRPARHRPRRRRRRDQPIRGVATVDDAGPRRPVVRRRPTSTSSNCRRPGGRRHRAASG